MIAASVETLSEPEPSPPVPTMSIASGGAFTVTIFARIAATAPVISSTVSPRTLSAMRNPPICEGVTSPDSIESKALSASVRVSVAPAATFAIRGLNDSMSPFSRSGCVLALMKGVGQVEEIAQDLPAMLAGDALGMELHPIRRTINVLNAHHEPLVGFRADLEFGGRA